MPGHRFLPGSILPFRTNLKKGLGEEPRIENWKSQGDDQLSSRYLDVEGTRVDANSEDFLIREYLGHEPAQVQGRHLPSDGGDGDGRCPEEEELVDEGQESTQDYAQRPCSEGESRDVRVIGLRYRKLHLLNRYLRILLWSITHPHMTMNEISPKIVFTTKPNLQSIMTWDTSSHATFQLLGYTHIYKRPLP